MENESRWDLEALFNLFISEKKKRRKRGSGVNNAKKKKKKWTKLVHPCDTFNVLAKRKRGYFFIEVFAHLLYAMCFQFLPINVDR